MPESSIEVKSNHLRWTQITYKKQVFVETLSSAERSGGLVDSRALR
jgi:hypothetical protein